MVLSTLAVIALIQLIVLLIGGVFFLFLHTRFLKKQIRVLRGDASDSLDVATQGPSDLTSEPEPSFDMEGEAPPTKVSKSAMALSDALTSQMEALQDTHVTGDIVELRKMLDEKLLLTANMRKLIEALDDDPDSVASVSDQQKSTLKHLEEYIKLSRREAAAVEDKIKQYKEQLIKAKKLLSQKTASNSSESSQEH